MSQQERGRSPVAAAATLVALVMVCHCRHVAHSKPTNYVVGDGKNEFIYDNNVHNVVCVDKKGFEDCAASSSDKSTVYKTGDDKIQLVLGTNYFINGKNNEACKQLGMKIMVTAGN
ncbi:early nodulin-like protein 22 [Striga hermonthica]|uniref:Early nodulin-like protein 22 n=1 Tax=Striga hermonthica TaxID=68872 RepID=A0A9N7NDJ4_STRHE|nr:early nodulin-like protein 22 [Striga hermonthica]